MSDTAPNATAEFADAIIARLQVKLVQEERILRTVKDYAGDIEEAKIDILMASQPAALLVVHARKFEDPAAVETDSEIEATLLVASKNLRSAAEALKGGAGGEPGMYELLERIRQALAGQRLPTDAEILGVTQWEALLVASDVCLYQMQLAATLTD